MIKNAGRGLLAWLRQPASLWFVITGVLAFIILGIYAAETGRTLAAFFCGFVGGYMLLHDIILPPIRKPDQS